MLNPEQDINIFSNLSCYGGNESELFDVGSASAVGVGILPNIVSIPKTTGDNNSSNDQRIDLSLSLIDGWPSPAVGSEHFSTKGLYLGVPPNLDLTDEPPGCALMMQYKGQTFPYYSYDTFPDNTSCPSVFTGWENDSDPICLAQLAEIISDFRYEGHSEMFSRCQALAHHVEATLRDKNPTNFCQSSYLAGGISV